MGGLPPLISSDTRRCAGQQVRNRSNAVSKLWWSFYCDYRCCHYQRCWKLLLLPCENPWCALCVVADVATLIVQSNISVHMHGTDGILDVATTVCHLISQRPPKLYKPNSIRSDPLHKVRLPYITRWKTQFHWFAHIMLCPGTSPLMRTRSSPPFKL